MQPIKKEKLFFSEQPECDQPAEHRGQRPQRKVVSNVTLFIFAVSRNTARQFVSHSQFFYKCRF